MNNRVYSIPKFGRKDFINRITIIISHRLASLMHANQIIYLKDGKISEKGTHEELIQLGGHYSRIYHLQTTIK